MTVTEIEEYYGKKAADWVRSKIADGTFKPSAVNIRLENPKCERQFLKIDDVIGYFDPDGWPTIQLPEHLRAFDFVRVEIEELLGPDDIIGTGPLPDKISAKHVKGLNKHKRKEKP